MKAKDSDTTDTLQRAQYFWEEYKYRHDHIWQRIFKFTIAIVLISIMPYIQKEIICILSYWVLIAPILAFLLSCFVFSVMHNELQLFGKIKKVYRFEQNKLMDDDLAHEINKQSTFDIQVMAYFGILVFLTIINCFIVGQVWIPKILALQKMC